MSRLTSDRHATAVRGYAWHCYPDPATPGVFEGDAPFASGEEGRESPPPAGVLAFWQVSKNAPGILNDTHHGNTYLAVTEAGHPPAVNPGWFVAPAQLDETFQIEQRGARWVHLVRFAGPSSPAGAPDCEFQVDRS